MSRKTCFMIFIAAVTIILVSYVIKFSPVTGAVSSVFAAMQNPYLATSAVVVSLLLAKQRYYWLLILGCAVLAAVLIQFFVVGGALAAAVLLYKIAAFVVYAYLIMLMRFML